MPKYDVDKRELVSIIEQIPIVVITTSTSYNIGIDDDIVSMSPATDATATLPGTHTVGESHEIKNNLTSGSVIVTVVSADGDTIGGAASYVLRASDALRVVSDGSNWIVMNATSSASGSTEFSFFIGMI